MRVTAGKARPITSFFPFPLLSISLLLCLLYTLASYTSFAFPSLHPFSYSAVHPLVCREYEANGQSCVFGGTVCLDTSANASSPHPRAFFVDHGHEDGEEVPNDRWCRIRYRTADPRSYGAREWPPPNDTVVPQRSCLDAVYRRPEALFGQSVRGASRNASKILWVPSLALVNYDFVNSPHNGHLLMDIAWVLDVVLWQKSLHLQGASLFHEGTPPHLYLPQDEADFDKQLGPDMNRILYALSLSLPLQPLYPSVSPADLKIPGNGSRVTVSFRDAYPELREPNRLLFHKELTARDDVNLVCTHKFSVGSKLANTGHERVCRHMRERAHELFGITDPPPVQVGRVYFSQPPKRIVILQRHITRRIANLDAVDAGLRKAFEAAGVEVEIVSTRALSTAEEQVRVFARAGVVVTPHGSQSVGQIWMRRHAALVEVMPVGYTDYSFQVLAESCKVWYYEVQGMRHPNDSKEYFRDKCGDKTPHMFTPCVTVKTRDVWVNVPGLVKVVRYAFERLGYETKDWMDFVQEG